MFQVEKKHIIWIITTILFLLAYFFIHLKNMMGVYFDVPAFFLGHYFNNENFFLLTTQDEIRNIPTIMISLIYNIVSAFDFTNISMAKNVEIFSFSFFVAHIVLLYANYLAAKRTKRYDICVAAFAFYTMFCIICFIWNIREFYVSFLFNFILLQYYFSAEKPKKSDIVIASVLSLLMFEMSEFNLVISILFLLFTCLYIKKNKNIASDSNPFFLKKLITGLSVAPAIYIALKTLYIVKFLRPTAASEWKDNFIAAFGHSLTTTIALSAVFACISLILIFFIKKDFTYKSIPAILIVLSVFLFIFKNRVNIYEVTWKFELCLYWISVVAFFFIVLYFFISEYFNFKAEKFNPYFYKNLIIISCIFGILNTSWQMRSCIEYGKLIQELKTIMNNSKEVITEIPETYYESNYKYSYLFNNFPCFGSLHISILLSDKYEVNRIIFPNPNKLEEYCFVDKTDNYYEENSDYIDIQATLLPLKSKYWDLTPIAEAYKEKGLYFPN